MSSLTQFASTSESSGLLGMLGIDWATLLFQLIAFLILVALLGKFVYPWLMKSVDERQSKIDEGARAADEAEKKAAAAQKEVAALLKEARREAGEIVSTAKTEASAAIELAETRAKDRADKIVEAAQDELAKEVVAAKKSLHNEMIDLVAEATETVLGNAVDSKVDAKIISAAVKEVQ